MIHYDRDRISHTIFSMKRGFAKRFVDVFRTSFGVAPGDAAFVGIFTSAAGAAKVN
jgi:hypothetical protein